MPVRVFTVLCAARNFPGPHGKAKNTLNGHHPTSLFAVLALTFTNLTVNSLKASALFDLLTPPLHMARLGVVLP
jgi:hypothetical protein